MFGVKGREKGWTGGQKGRKDCHHCNNRKLRRSCVKSLSLGLTSFFLTMLLISQIDHVILSAKINHNKHVHSMLFLPVFKKNKKGGGGDGTVKNHC